MGITAEDVKRCKSTEFVRNRDVFNKKKEIEDLKRRLNNANYEIERSTLENSISAAE